MKKYFIFGCLALLFTATACSDWTETEGKNIDKLLADADAAQAKAYEAYLENLVKVLRHVVSIIFPIAPTSFHYGMAFQT